MKNFTPKVPIRAQMVRRSWLIVASMMVLGGIIIVRIIYLQTVKKEELIEQVKDLRSKERTIYANRGNILASDGKGLLATTVPKFVVAIDPSKIICPKDTISIKRKGKSDSTVIYKEQVAELSTLLSKRFKEKTAAEYQKIILTARKENRRYIRLIKKMISVEDYLIVNDYPFYKDSKRLRGGILERHYIREYPFGKTAKRTIGNVLDNKAMKGAYGIEYSFNGILAGTNGYGFYDKISGGYWRAVEAQDDVQPEAGKDIVTTLDVNFQDIAETALMRQVKATDAKYGTVVVMEVQTGEIKAMANYGRRSSNGETYYVDNKNYAVTEGSDPGSTFKLASMLALIEKTNLPLDQLAVDCKGSIQHSKGIVMTCSHVHGRLSVREVFEKSCNIGVYRLMRKHFGFTKTTDFFAYINKFQLNTPIGFQLIGSSKPVFVSPDDKKRFSHTTVPWTSIGYEMKLTPLQTLSFYNAVANNGYWVEPIIVKEIREANEIIETFEARKLSAPICSPQSVRLAKKMLEGVVMHGTASNINEGYCQVAGKTGTAQKRTGGYRNGPEVYTSFAGYFPANNPKYSCIVVIDEPKNGSLYGNTIAAPVFREIADKLFAYDVNIHPTKKLTSGKNYLAQRLHGGEASDFKVLAENLNMRQKPDKPGWVYAKAKSNKQIDWQPIRSGDKSINPKGLVLRDALHLLENAGYSVTYSGTGKVNDYALTSSGQVVLFLQ
ncbi:MAG: cell division protein FtsI (penicillin-binding protein 3) [Spirosomataceae bacterium]|jgi:cell division protein FtsI (penicillin-binding protein 3)